jgi:hypothetical protein
VICQIVVKEEYRKAVVGLAHDSSMTEHLGVKENIQWDIVPFLLAE